MKEGETCCKVEGFFKKLFAAIDKKLKGKSESADCCSTSAEKKEDEGKCCR